MVAHERPPGNPWTDHEAAASCRLTTYFLNVCYQLADLHSTAEPGEFPPAASLRSVTTCRGRYRAVHPRLRLGSLSPGWWHKPPLGWTAPRRGGSLCRSASLGLLDRRTTIEAFEQRRICESWRAIDLTPIRNETAPTIGALPAVAWVGVHETHSGPPNGLTCVLQSRQASRARASGSFEVGGCVSNGTRRPEHSGQRSICGLFVG